MIPSYKNSFQLTKLQMQKKSPTSPFLQGLSQLSSFPEQDSVSPLVNSVRGITSKTKDLVELDRLLHKYGDELVEGQQIPLVANIRRRCKKIQKLRRVEEKNKISKIGKILTEKDKCYICRIKNDQPHHHYRQMCVYCGETNFSKRTFKADLSGKIALVTGARIKIGYYTAISLLRNGAHVIATTRFAYDAVERFMQEADYLKWKDRLEIVQTSMNSFKSITELTNYVKTKFKRLDILVNNAAQTIRRPRAFYSTLQKQKHDPDNLVKLVIDDYFIFNNDKLDMAIEYEDIKIFIQEKQKEANAITNSESQKAENMPLIVEQRDEEQSLDEVQMSLVRKLSNNELKALNPSLVKEYYEKNFPKDIIDEHAQQIDLRPINSWVRSLEDTNVLELGEVLMINCIAPFTMIQQLVPIMKNNTPDEIAWVVNVSSMEGMFNRRFKTQFHPHTNVAKAGLNMITRTCSEAFYKNSIVMVSVDTGWNTIQEPNSYHQKSPLDCIDGAARILDPIYRKLNKPGIFYKNYQKCDW